MLKYIKNHMATISGIEIYPIISFLIFFLFFLVVLWMMFKADKGQIKKMSMMPLDNELNEDGL